MRRIFTFFGILFFSNFCTSQTSENEDVIIGTFFSNLYSCHELDEDLSLVKDVPKEFYSGEIPYKDEYDVGWQLDFLKTGEIKITQLFYMYCGTIVILEKGQWKKVDDNLYTIRLEGTCYDNFMTNNKYYLIDSNDGIRRLKIKHNP